MAELIDIKAEREKLQKKALEDNKVVTERSILDDIEAVPSKYPNREFAEENDPDLRYMNTRYAFVHSIGGKPMIKAIVYNEYFKKDIVEFVAPESLCMRYTNRLAEETRSNKNGGMSIGKWWLGHAHRRDYETVTFEPDKAPGEYNVRDQYAKDGLKTYFNMWEGFGVDSKKGCWTKTCKHIYRILCNGNRTKFIYVMRWLGWAVQNPGNRAEVALIFKGKKGAGKGLILQSMVKMFGRHGLVISNREHLTGKHNEHLATCSFLFADEAYHPGDKEVEGILKNIITEPSLTTEPKFRGLKIGRNCLHIAMATNADWIIPATEDERRYFINEVDNRYAKGSCSDNDREEYFDAIWKELTDGGLSAMLYDLLHMQLGDWHPRKNVPETEEMRKQIEMSLPKLKYAFLTMLEEGVFPGEINGKGEYIISNTNLLEYFKQIDSANKNITGKSLANLCKSLGITFGRSGTGRYLIFPELGAIRETWSNQVNKNTEWRINEKWEVKPIGF